VGIPHVSLYHITHIDNLPGIIKDDRLRCDHDQREEGAKHQNIGYSHIKERRRKHPVKVSKRGTLGNYVPFYFCYRSVMLFVIHKGHYQYKGGQEPIVHLVTTVAKVAEANPACFYTDRHADLAYAEQFDDLKLLPAKVDLSIMRKGFWAESQEIREKRQAEFLVYDACPWSAIVEIVVHNSDIALKMQSALEKAKHKPLIHVRKNWYYEG
jgi:hypothetical protein